MKNVRKGEEGKGKRRKKVIVTNRGMWMEKVEWWWEEGREKWECKEDVERRSNKSETGRCDKGRER